MRRAEQVLSVLRRRGELWEVAPGLLGLRGDALELFRALERAIRATAIEETSDEWQIPAGIALETLARADYFESFPQWLTVASHLSDDAATLEAMARAEDPTAAACRALAPASAALAPALCYHTYAYFAGQTLSAPRLMTGQGTCWRYEGPRLRALARGWAFTMREIVCLGGREEVEAFRQRGLRRGLGLAHDLGLEAEIVTATDPFFAPTGRGKALLQQVKALKHELVIPIGPEDKLAVASFNHHEAFFGEAFGIRLAAGEPACSGCVAFGIERWLLAFLVAQGPEVTAWAHIPEAVALAP